MRYAYVDTSAVVAIAFGEREAEVLARQVSALERLFAAGLLEAEYRAAARREGLADDLRVLAPIAWILPNRPLTGEMGRVLAVGDVRGVDLVHLSTALYLSPNPAELGFLTRDEQQARAARALGFRLL